MTEADLEVTEAGPARRADLWPIVAFVAVLCLAVAGVVGLFFLLRDDGEPIRKVPEIKIVNLIQPPPPPPPPPPPQQKMVEQTPVKEEVFHEEKPIEQPKQEPQKVAKADEPPPGPLSLDQKSDGPGDLFNLGSKVGGRGLLGGPAGGGSRWGWYASIVQSQIESALRANAKTRTATIQVQLRLWSDAGGRITRVELVTSTGNADLDGVIRNEVLAGLVLRQPPPKDMPMPIVARISERRPG